MYPQINLINIYQKNDRGGYPTNANGKIVAYLCNKHVHFNYGGKIYLRLMEQQWDHYQMMPQPNIFMAASEITIIPLLENWNLFVDDTFAFILPDTIGYLILKF